MDPKSPLARHQRRRLGQLRDLGLCTDDSIATALRELGAPCDRSTVSKYLDGTRGCPIGLLDVLLSHVDSPAEVLQLWASPRGLMVVPTPVPTGRSVQDEALDVVQAAMRIVDAHVRGASAGEIVRLGHALSTQGAELVGAAAAEAK